jgi:hypothetical protein
METITREFNLVVGCVEYSFTIKFWYYEGERSDDPRFGEEDELVDWEFDSQIFAYDLESSSSWEVRDELEIKSLVKKIDVLGLFEEAIS